MTNKLYREGWTKKDIIQELKPALDMIQSGRSYNAIITNKADLKKYCDNNMPYWKHCPSEIINYFCKLYKINN